MFHARGLLAAKYMNLIDLLLSPDVFASTLLVLAVDRIGQELFDADNDGRMRAPEALRQEFERQFGVKLPDDNLGKLVAAGAVMTSDALYRSLPSFLFTVHGLLGDGTDWSYAEPIEAEDLAWAVMEALLIWPPDEEDLFDPQIVAYCRTILQREGLMSPPAILSFAREEAVYGDLGSYDADILAEQASRTEDVNAYIEEQQIALLQQLEDISFLGCTADALLMSIRQELQQLAGAGAWT